MTLKRGQEKGRLAHQEHPEARIASVALVFASILLLGAVGYHWVEGWSWLESLYMATITVTTVGYGEIHPLSAGGRAFTIVLILLGVGGITYAFRTLADYVIAGELKGFLEERRMKRHVGMLSNHFIICGYGRLGHEVCIELSREGRELVIVDTNTPSLDHAREMGYAVIAGDAGFDTILLQAGIKNAAGLVASSDDDAKNILVVLSARALNPKLSIVARVSSEEATDKFIRAGANSVFLPYKTGGRRMAQVLLRPEVAGFLEVVLHDEAELGFLLENFIVGRTSALVGKNLGELRIRERTGASIVGLKRKASGIIPNLEPSTVFDAGDTIIALGSREQLSHLAKLLN
jgi:voltage-gated potassium channel